CARGGLGSSYGGLDSW
nr:immunoglobulin heavy chain junction region [Macaca mulatta]MOY21192.1 immunoglobulin heavy chain junction region [Macaca mulatta]MOY22169.1 immunoglobulin heavy chain junction region [Macaca mulatta]MOY22205.1 immunoglobulin heavy chain junction region [Macaca mulatta]MOY22754.1 immunoglobulin heavy chain junction region [Macaca mulatta]